MIQLQYCIQELLLHDPDLVVWDKKLEAKKMLCAGSLNYIKLHHNYCNK